MTSFEEIYDLFLTDIREDSRFFFFDNIDEIEQLELINSKCKSLLLKAITEFKLNCNMEIDLDDYDKETDVFNVDLVNSEKQILKDLMKEKYIGDDVIKLKVFENHFTPKEIQVFSPSNDRKTFMEMYDYIKNENRQRINQYAALDRLTGKPKTLSFDIG